MSKTGLRRGGMTDIAIAKGLLWETTSQGGRAEAESLRRILVPVLAFSGECVGR